jgi:hypothetical protein
VTLPPVNLDGLERLDFYRRSRASEALEEERRRIEDIRSRKERGEPLTEQEWVIFSYSPLGSAAGCGCGR